MKINKIDAIRIIDRITDKDDPYWENLVDDFYDSINDDWPTILDVFKALGVSKEEYERAVKIK